MGKRLYKIPCFTSLRHPPSNSPLIKPCRSIPTRYAPLLFSPCDVCARCWTARARSHRTVVQDSPNTTRRPYVCPPLWVHRPSVPQHWDLTSGDKRLDIKEEDGYVLSANDEGPTPGAGAFVPCEPLSAVRRARPGRLRIKSWILHRRRVSGIITTSSPTSQSVSSVLTLLMTYPPLHQSIKQSISQQLILSSTAFLWLPRL